MSNILNLYGLLGLDNNFLNYIDFDALEKDYDSYVYPVKSIRKEDKFMSTELADFSRKWRINPYSQIDSNIVKFTKLFEVYNRLNKEIPIYTVCTTVTPLNPEVYNELYNPFDITNNPGDIFVEAERMYRINHNYSGGFVSLMKSADSKLSSIEDDMYVNMMYFREYQVGRLINEVIKRAGINFEATLGFSSGNPPSYNNRESIVNLYDTTEDRVDFCPQIHFQYVPNTVTFREFMEDQNSTMIVNGYRLNYEKSMILLIEQVIYMLSTINKYYRGFIHGSLDLENIKVAKTGKSSYRGNYVSCQVYIGNYSKSLISRSNTIKKDIHDLLSIKSEYTREYDKIDKIVDLYNSVARYHRFPDNIDGLKYNIHQFLYNLLREYSVLNYGTIEYRDGRWMMKSESNRWISVSFLSFLYRLCFEFFGLSDLKEISQTLLDISRLDEKQFDKSEYPEVFIYFMDSLNSVDFDVPVKYNVSRVKTYSESQSNRIIMELSESTVRSGFPNRIIPDMETNYYRDDLAYLTNYYVLLRYFLNILHREKSICVMIDPDSILIKNISEMYPDQRFDKISRNLSDDGLNILDSLRLYFTSGIYEQFTDSTLLIQGLLRALAIVRFIPELSDLKDKITESIRNTMIDVDKYLRSDLVVENDGHYWLNTNAFQLAASLGLDPLSSDNFKFIEDMDKILQIDKVVQGRHYNSE